MLQSHWEATGIVLQDVVLPPLPAGWVRLSVAACGICGSDLHHYRHPESGVAGAVPGHELTGTVIDGPPGLADRLYAVEPWVPCGECDFCRAGRPQLCRSAHLIGGAHLPGGFAEFIDVPAGRLHPVPPALSPLEGSFTEPLGISLRAVRLAEVQVDSRVLMLGAGTLGLAAGLIARDVAGQVAVSARYQQQAAVASALGLQPVMERDLARFAKDFEPDVVIETVGGEAGTINQALQVARPGGRVVVLGLFSAPVTIDARTLVMKELHLLGSKVFGTGEYGSDFHAAAERLPRYRAELKLLQTHQYPLTEVAQAFAQANDKTTGAIKVTVLPGS